MLLLEHDLPKLPKEGTAVPSRQLYVHAIFAKHVVAKISRGEPLFPPGGYVVEFCLDCISTLCLNAKPQWSKFFVGLGPFSVPDLVCSTMT